MRAAKQMFLGSTSRRALPAILIALLAVGCVSQPNTPMPANVTPFGRNVTLIYVPGIGGFGGNDQRWLKGLRAGGYEGKAEVRDWTGRLGPISALWAHARQRSEAHRIAGQLRKLRSQGRGAPVVLVAHSAGAGVAVAALEELPPGVQVDELVLLAPALSRSYDLTRALRHVRGRADVFYSERDTLVLAFGTFLFGTVDGVHGEAAGHGGFIKPQGASAAAYWRLVAHPYSSDRRLRGDDGGHHGVLGSGMAAWLVAPLLPGHQSHEGSLARNDARDLP